LVEEVRSLVPYRSHNALQTVGYKEVFEHIDGKISLEETVTHIKTNTRQYAKRQMTWFKKDPEMEWLAPTPENISVVVGRL
jgi:tRNA dimethylallyltransferase